MDQHSPKRKPQLKSMDLMATTAHELKSPLVLINGLAEMLKDGQFGALNSRQARYIARIDNASERLLTMVENLLTINRSHHGRLNVNFESVSAVATINHVLAELQPRIREKKVTVVWAPQIQMPPVTADGQMLYQIFYNLFDNSLKYSPPRTSLTIKMRAKQEFVSVEIDDQGYGIQPKELERLFDKFGSFEKPLSARGVSSGLGLYIVKNLVELMGGKVTAKRLRRGTRFILQLPIIQQMELFNDEGKLAVKTDKPSPKNLKEFG